MRVRSGLDIGCGVGRVALPLTDYLDDSGGYDGFNAHGTLLSRPGLEPVVHHEDDWFLLDIVRRIS